MGSGQRGMSILILVIIPILIWAYTGDKVPQINAGARREKKK